MFVRGMRFQPSLELVSEVGAYPVLHSKVGACPYPRKGLPVTNPPAYY
jgi:hypothetical protein